MDEPFLINVIYQNVAHEFQTHIRWMGYTHKIEVDVFGALVHFEPDEERNYRAVLLDPTAESSKEIKPGLLQTIATYLEEQVKSN